ncbi:MAG TPA: PKD domain-containing protein [Chloroflexota bacterium]|nr:PKD domain-containing protein [Chloroflexota bacterium]
MEYTGSGEDIYWNSTAFAADQEAYVTLQAIDLEGEEIGLVLKSQSSTGYDSGLLVIAYNIGLEQVMVWSFLPGSEWTSYGKPIPITFEPDDQFGVRAMANGQVEVYKNGMLSGTRDVSTWPYYNQGGYIGLFPYEPGAIVFDDFGGGTLNPIPFPITEVLDDFNRADGAIGGNWSGSTTGYAVADNQLAHIGSGEEDIYWNSTAFAVDQEAYITLQAIDLEGEEIGLVLKSQSSTGYDSGLLEIVYNPDLELVTVWSYLEKTGWVSYGKPIPITFEPDDQFGVRAMANGQVEVYKNGALVGTRNVSGWPYYDQGGYIGLFGYQAGDAILDDFGGGSVDTSPAPTPTPTPTATPTNTPTPTATPSLRADFTADPVIGNAPLAVNFYDNSVGSITSYLWNFGDSGSSVMASPVHTYTESGIYTVSLTVTDASNQHTLTRTNYIFVNPPVVSLPNQAPVITITTPSLGSVTDGTSVQVSGEVTDDGMVQSVEVNGVAATIDGDTFSANITVTGGNQTINAVAEDDEGAMGFDSTVIRVDDEGPIIDIIAPPDRQAVYTLNPTVTVAYRDFLSAVVTNTLSVELTDENSMTDDVTSDLVVGSDSATGVLSTPLSQDTSYTLTVTLEDEYGNSGVAISRFYVPISPTMITPPSEPDGAAWASGVVYDSSTCNEHLTTCQGLSGVAVTFSYAGSITDSITGTIVTGPDGFFAFPFTETGVYWLRAEKDGYTYSQREIAVVRERSTAVNEIYLTPIDSTSTVCENDTVDCLHESSDGRIQVVIPPGAITEGDVVTVTATMFDRVYFLPSGQLPPGTWETYAFNLGGDSDYVFQKPVTVTISNTLGFAPGTLIPLGYWNQSTLQWEHEGVATVDEAGEWLVMRVSHFSNHDPNFPIVPVFISLSSLWSLLQSLTGNDAPCPDGVAGCFINFKSGELQEWVDLPGVNVLGETIAPQLRYSTERANPSGLIEVQLDVEVTGNIDAEYIQWQLYIEGERTNNFTFAADLSTSGEVGRYRLLWDGRNAQSERLPAGMYNYALRIRVPFTAQYCRAVGNVFGNPPDCRFPIDSYVTATQELWSYGTVALDSTVDNPLGQGWALAGQQHLHEDEAGNLLVAEASSLTEYYFTQNDALEGRGQYSHVQPHVLGPSAAIPIPPLPISGTYVSGTINTHATWTAAQSPYIVTGTVTVADGVTLTVEPGVQVMFDQYQSLLVEGGITAVGTITQPITFTAYVDGPFQSWEKYDLSTFDDTPVQAIAVAANGDIWFAGFYEAGSGPNLGQVHRLKADLQTWDSYNMPGTFNAFQVTGMAIDSMGQKWIATSNGVIMLDIYEDWTIYQSGTPGLVSNFVNAVTVDADDNIWFGTNAGVSKLAGSSWTTYQMADGLASNTVYAIAASSDGAMWFGTDSGLSRLDSGNNWTTYDTGNSGILGDIVEDIAIDRDNNVWMVTSVSAIDGGGVSVLRQSDEWFTYTPDNSGLASPFVRSIAVDRGGRKWVGYEMDGVSILAADNSAWEFETTPRLSGETIVDIAAAPGGDVWLAHGSDGATRSYGSDGVSTDSTIRSGYWHTLQIGGGSDPDDSDGSHLSYVTIEAAGADLLSSLKLYHSSPALDNITIIGGGGDGLHVVESDQLTLEDGFIAANRQTGVRIEGGGGGHTLANVTIQANGGHGVALNHAGGIVITGTFITGNNGYGIFTEHADNALELGNSVVERNEIPARLAVNAFLGEDNEWLDNTHHQLEWIAGTMDNNRIWASHFDAHIVLGEVTVAEGVTLTVEPGTTVLFHPDVASLDVPGTLQALGTFDDPIYFGITHGWRWGGLSLPGSGDSVLRYVIIESAETALFVHNATPVLEYLTFIGNGDGLAVSNSEGLIITNSNFQGNSFGLRNNTPGQPVTAVNNYWGATTGPTHTSNPGGNGEEVSDGVIFDPWRGPVLMDGINPFLQKLTATDRSVLTFDVAAGVYVRHYPNGYSVHFDSQGRHDTTHYPDGRLLSYTYNPDGTTASMSITAAGESTPHWTWAFSYTNGLLDSITDPAGRATDFIVDANGQLAAASFPDGSSRAFFYNASGLLTEHIDKNGAINSFAYDGYGRVLTDTRPIRAVYDPATGQASPTAEARLFTPSDTAYPLINDSAVGDPDDPAPAMPLSADLVDAVAFGRGGLSGYTNQWGNWTEMTDATGRTVQYERDEANNVIQQTYPDGACDRFSYDAFGHVLSARRMGAADCALSNPTSFQEVVMTYEPRFNQVKTITDPLGRVTTYIYDYEEDIGQAGQVIRIEYAPVLDEGGNWVTPTVRYTYNSLGLMETEEDKNGAVTRYVYTTITDTHLFLPGVTPVPGLLTQVIRDEGGLELTTTYRDFDAHGTALLEIGPGGAALTHYLTDEMGRVISQTNPAGATTLFAYDLQGNLVQRIEDYTPDGVTGANLVTLYTYDADNRLLTEDRVGDGLMVRTSHAADINGNPSHSENALGYERISLYDDANRLVSTIDPAGQTVTYTHDLNGRVETFTDVDGVVRRTFYDDFSRVIRTVNNWQDGLFDPDEPDQDIETLTAYDLVGNTVIVTDTLGRMTRTFYDNLNRVQGTITNWDGLISLADCDNLPLIRDENICTRHRYDPAGNTVIITDTLGRMNRTFYDELSRVTATVVNWNPATLSSPADCLLSPTNESEENICTLRGYDSKGNLITTTNALNQTNLTVYDAANRPVIQVTNWDGTTVIEEETDCHFPPPQPDRNICSVTTYDSLGRQLSSKDALGNVTSYGYDSLGRLVTTTRTLDGQPVISVTGYDVLGRRISQTNAEGHTTYFLYDNLGRLIASRSPEGVTSSTVYDAAGQAIASTDNLGHTSHTAYDALGRVITATNAARDTTVYEYDGLGNQVAVIDAEGVRTTTQYDGLNRRIAAVQNDTGGAPTADSNLLTQYLYDALGNQLVITNALNFTRSHTTYDSLNRAIIVEDALGNQTFSHYNALGLRLVMTDANEAITRYEYDGLNRLVHTIYEADNETVSTSYDALGNRQVMTDSIGTTHYEYDDLYRLITVTTPFTGTVLYGYDLVGNRNQITYPDGKVVTYTHDGDNRLLQVFDWDEGVTTYEYDLAGRLVSTLLPNGVETTEQYDAANRLIRRTHTDTISGTLQADYIYDLDGLGNHQVVTETIRPPGGGGLETTVVSYTYDPLYRVTEAAYSGILSGTYEYVYDALGNRKEFATNITTTQAITYSYDAANRLLESVDLDSSQVTTYTWDNAGRLITTTVGGNVTRVYSYSQDGDLIAALVDGLLTAFVYDGQGHRLQMSVDGEVVTYTLDYAGGFRILLEEGGEFSDTKHYLYGLACLGEHVDADEPETAEWRYYQRDGKNLVRQTSDQEGAVTFAWTYSPTGGVLLGEKGPVTYLDCGDNAIYDWSTGLIFKRGRYFDPTNSLWITLSGVVVWQTWPPDNRRRRRQKDKQRNRKWILLLLLLFMLLLAGCGGGGETPTPTCTPTTTPGLPGTGTPTPGQPDTSTPPTVTVPPTQPPTVTPPPTHTPPPTVPPPTVPPPSPPTPSEPPPPEPPTPSLFPLSAPPDGVKSSTFTRYKTAWETLRDKHEPGNQSLHDDVVIGFIIWTELKSISSVPVPWGEALEALSYQYSSRGFHFTGAYGAETCVGHCNTIEKELRWLDEFAAFYAGDISLIVASWDNYQTTAQDIQNAPPSTDINKGSYPGPINRNSHVWGNYFVGDNSLMENYVNNSGWDPFTAQGPSGPPDAPWWTKSGPPLQANYGAYGFVVFSGEQRSACTLYDPSCIGWRPGG